jgi:murein DD-endopeptidase MepM/ murein hydrolase activator NlpD
LAARSVLDGRPDQAGLSQHWTPPAVGARHSRRRFEQTRSATATTMISLRYAAHMVVVALVAIVLFSAGASTWAGVMRLDPVAPTPATSLENADQAVGWAPPSGVGANDDTPAQPALRNPQPQFEPVFVATHELAEGETLGQLASRYRVNAASLFWANDLDRGDILAAGQAFRIPRIDGLPHVIQPDETLESIAALFHVTPQAIMLLGANGLSKDQPLPVGREIFIPGGTRPYPAEILARYGNNQGVAAMTAVAAGVVQESDTNLRTGPGRGYPRVGYLDAGHRLKLVARYNDWVKVDTGAAGAGWVRADLLGLPDATLSALPETNDFPPLPLRWMWPTRGSITSPFGWRRAPFRSFHDGLDIANAAGTRIYAARAGQVIEAGWCSGFGYCVKIDHGEGVTTIYGHMLKKPPVRVDDAVEAGDLIGFMGSTFDRSGGGYSTGVHLHFTVKVNGKAVNPLKFLP